MAFPKGHTPIGVRTKNKSTQFTHHFLSFMELNIFPTNIPASAYFAWSFQVGADRSRLDFARDCAEIQVASQACSISNFKPRLHSHTVPF